MMGRENNERVQFSGGTAVEMGGHWFALMML